MIMMNPLRYMLTTCLMLIIIKGFNAMQNNLEKDAQILSKNGELKADGSYHSGYATSNGIKRQDYITNDGHMEGITSYLTPEGIEIKTTYIADETGYHPIGDHIPKIPDYIIRSLEYIRLHPYIEKDYYTGEFKTPKTPTIPTKPSAIYQHLQQSNL